MDNDELKPEVFPGPIIGMTIKEFEKWLRDIYIPHSDPLCECWGFFSLDGTLEYFVQKRFLDAFTAEEVDKVQGKIFSHNHPSGTTISANDVLTAASLRMAEIRAVTKENTFSITPINGNWPPREDIEKTMKDIKSTDYYKKISDKGIALDYCLRTLSKEGLFQYFITPVT